MKKIAIIASLMAICAYASCNVITAFKTGEYQDTERKVKVCVYNGLGKNYYYSVASYGICPVSIQTCQRF